MTQTILNGKPYNETLTKIGVYYEDGTFEILPTWETAEGRYFEGVGLDMRVGDRLIFKNVRPNTSADAGYDAIFYPPNEEHGKVVKEVWLPSDYCDMHCYNGEGKGAECPRSTPHI